MTSTGVLGPMTTVSTAGEAASGAERVRRWLRHAALGLLLAVLLGLAWLVAFGKLYEPGSDLGYNLGLAGGLLMLSMLVYPLRKRLRVLAGLGSMAGWFKFHMVAGIGGPLLILFHSTFKTASMNGSVALYAMLLVASSGVVGRFLYRHIHRGLYGRQITLAEAGEDLKASAESLRSVFALAADIEPRLKAFHDAAFAGIDSLRGRLWRFVSLRWRSRRLLRELRQEAKQALRRLARQEDLPRAELLLSYHLARQQIERYLDAVVCTSQLASWERLFSLWHVIHIPFLYLFVFSGIVHVLAVHMY
jgi:hypothetical protein